MPFKSNPRFYVEQKKFAKLINTEPEYQEN